MKENKYTKDRALLRRNLSYLRGEKVSLRIDFYILVIFLFTTVIMTFFYKSTPWLSYLIFGLTFLAILVGIVFLVNLIQYRKKIRKHNLNVTNISYSYEKEIITKELSRLKMK